MPRQHQPSFWEVWLLLLVALAVFAPGIFKMASAAHWFDLGEPPNKPNDAAVVWVAKQTGFYYCTGSSLYGKVSPGLTMTQQQALAQGYRSATTRYCQ
jgi:hypothetical protein